MFRSRRKCSHVPTAHNVLPSTRCEKLARSQHARYTGRSSLLLQILCKSIDLDICAEVDIGQAKYLITGLKIFKFFLPLALMHSFACEAGGSWQF